MTDGTPMPDETGEDERDDDHPSEIAMDMANLHHPRYMSRFHHLIEHAGVLLPDLREVNRKAMFMAYCAGRMHQCDELADLSALHRDGCTVLVARALAAFSEEHGVDEETLRQRRAKWEKDHAEH